MRAATCIQEKNKKATVSKLYAFKISNLTIQFSVVKIPSSSFTHKKVRPLLQIKFFFVFSVVVCSFQMCKSISSGEFSHYHLNDSILRRRETTTVPLVQ